MKPLRTALPLVDVLVFVRSRSRVPSLTRGPLLSRRFDPVGELSFFGSEIHFLILDINRDLKF
jgi:hypothetical protein